MHKLAHFSRALFALFLLSLIGTSLPLRSAQAAQAITPPSGWWWMHNVDANTVKAKIDEGFRITDLDVVSTAPMRFNAVFVQNSGANQSGWWWYYNVSPVFIKNKLDEKNARLIDIERYVIDGQTRYAAVMISNSGANQSGWWWYFNATPSFISDKLDEHNARLTDIESYVINGQRRYAVIMQQNSGENAIGWWWYYNATPEFIKQKINEKHARLIDIEGHGNGRFSVAMIANTGANQTSWWWYYGQSISQISEHAANNGARIIDLERYSEGNNTVYAAIMVNNVNELSANVGRMLRQNTDAERIGFLLKQVDGPVLAGLRTNTAFYSASSMKVLHHLHALRWATPDPANRLATQMTIYSNSCSESGTITQETLNNSLRLMMRNSDNDRTNAIQNYFTADALNTTAHEIVGMSSASQVNAGFGSPCGGPSQEQPNRLTPNDIGKLYERVIEGEVLAPAMLQTFRNLMPNEQNDFFLEVTIDEEAAALNISAETLDEFKKNVRMMHKHGSWGGDSGPFWGVRAGYVGLPIRAGANIITRGYVYSVFVENTTFYAPNFTPGTAVRELLREQIRRALITWQPTLTLRAGFAQTVSDPSGVLQLSLPTTAFSETVGVGMARRPMITRVITYTGYNDVTPFYIFDLHFNKLDGTPVDRLDAPANLSMGIDPALLARYGREGSSLRLLQIDPETGNWREIGRPIDPQLAQNNELRIVGEISTSGTFALASLGAEIPIGLPNADQPEPSSEAALGAVPGSEIYIPFVK